MIVSIGASSRGGRCATVGGGVAASRRGAAAGGKRIAWIFACALVRTSP